MSQRITFLAALTCFIVTARADLDPDIRAIVQDPMLARAQVAVEVAKVGPAADRLEVIYALNAAAPLAPASNMKLVTTSTALDKLGPDFRFQTLLVRHGEDVILVGDGDPTLGDAELLKKSNWDVTTVFGHWAEQLKKRNITSVGNVLVDDSVFDQSFFHPHWDERSLHQRYSAQVAGVNLNANCVDFYLQPAASGQVVRYGLNPATNYITVVNKCLTSTAKPWLTRAAERNEVTLAGGCNVANVVPISITVHDPSLYAGMVLAETLQAAGIKVSGGVARDRTVRARIAKKTPDAGYAVLAVHETPLPQVVNRANKDSMNLYAESLCKRNGFAATGESGSWENGTATAAALLKRLGVAEAEYHLDDGCGLSKDNGISSNALVLLLNHNFHAKYAQTFMSSLAVAGQDGTLEKRFEGSDLRGRVMAKTGFIDHVSALSGYLKTKDDQWYIFSILMNGVPRETNWKMKELQEAIVKAVDVRVSGRGR